MPARRSSVAVCALLLCLAVSFHVAPDPAGAQEGWEPWHWYVQFPQSGTLREVFVYYGTDAEIDGIRAAGEIVLTYRTETELQADLCASITSVRRATVPGSESQTYLAGDYRGQTYGVSGVFTDNGACRSAMPDGDGDGVPDSWDSCPGTVPGARVVMDVGCAIAADSPATPTPQPTRRPPTPTPTPIPPSEDLQIVLQCGPEDPEAGDPVVCAVDVVNPKVGEEIEFSWYVDYAHQVTSPEQVFVWSPEEDGRYNVAVLVAGEMRTADAETTVQVGGDLDEALQISLVCAPLAPVVGSQVTCDARVTNAGETEELTYSWYVDGAHKTTSPYRTFVWTADDEATYEVAVWVDGDARNGDVATTVDVGPASPDPAAAAFDIAGLSCEGESSDDDLRCAATLVRDADFSGRLVCTWWVDGLKATSQETTSSACAYTLPRIAPGEHEIMVEVEAPAAGTARRARTSVEIGSGALAPPEPDEISGVAQAGAALGTTGAVAAWLWLEWRRARRHAVDDDALAAERQRWYEQQMARNDAERAARQVRDDQQQALAAEWDRLWNGLMEISRRSEGMDHILEWVERHRDDVYRDGKWDAEAMRWLQEGARRLGAAQTDRALYNAKKAFADTVTPAMETVFAMSRSAVVRTGTDILTAGTGEIVWTPMSALDTMWTQVSVHKASADQAAATAYRGTVKQTASNVLWNRVGVGAGKVFSEEIDAVKDVASGAARRWLANRSSTTQRIVKTLTTPVDGPLRTAVDRWRRRPPPELPTIRHTPGGPETYLDAPTPHVQRWQRLRDLGLADDVETVLRRSGSTPDIQPVHTLQRGQGVTLTPDEEIGRRLLNHPNYRQAVTDGAVPRPVHELVNATRDKLGRQAIHRAFEDVRLRRPDLADRIARVEVTGTGARPRSAPATGGWTDLDVTVRGVDDSVASRLAEQEFSDAMSTRLREAGVDPGRADIHTFSGLRARTSGTTPDAYQSPGMVHWQETDVTFRGRVAIQTEGGTTAFDAHPDVRPMPGQEPLVNPTERMRGLVQIDPDTATADARRIVQQHVAEMPDHLGRPPDRLQILRSEGKHARRVWWVRHAGHGAQAPPGLRVIDRIKSDRTYVPGDDELDAAWRAFTDILDLGPANTLGEHP